MSEAPMSEPADGQADLTSGLTELAALLPVEDAEEALRHLARMAVVVVPDGPTCGITVRRRSRYTTMVHAVSRGDPPPG
jgi:hypothetical protein